MHTTLLACRATPLRPWGRRGMPPDLIGGMGEAGVDPAMAAGLREVRTNHAT
jgi:hypothetical protein